MFNFPMPTKSQIKLQNVIFEKLMFTLLYIATFPRLLCMVIKKLFILKHIIMVFRLMVFGRKFSEFFILLLV